MKDKVLVVLILDAGTTLPHTPINPSTHTPINPSTHTPINLAMTT